MEDEVNNDLINLIKQAEESFKELVEEVEKETKIDEFDIDSEALKIPKLHHKYSVMLANESVSLIKYQQLQKRIHMERWKYYNGKQTDAYYAKHGIVNDKILKGDIDKYLYADKRLGYAYELLEIQKQVVNFLERTIKDITNRGFHIKSVIEWRKFEAGVV